MAPLTDIVGAANSAGLCNEGSVVFLHLFALLCPTL